MGDIFFLIKTFILTGLVILFLQIKVGKDTLERKTEKWVKSSILVGQLQEVADGAIIVGKKLYREINNSINESKVGEQLDRSDQPGYRLLGKNLKRSKSYLKKKAKQAKKILKEEAEEFQEEYIEEYLPLEDSYEDSSENEESDELIEGEIG